MVGHQRVVRRRTGDERIDGTFAFTARKYSDGSVKGEAQVDNRAQGVMSHFTLNCLVVSGTTAYVSGNVDRTNSTVFQAGDPAFFGVRDNGEGTNAPPDQISLVFINLTGGTGTPPTPCTNPLFQANPTIPIDSGNIQVH
jgi:hypothetical protein